VRAPGAGSGTAAAYDAPWCKCDSVAEDSPAAAAGLREGDVIVRFGTLSKLTAGEGLASLGALVGANKGVELKIVVLREAGTSYETLRLTPNEWSGRGMLGCHVVPY